MDGGEGGEDAAADQNGHQFGWGVERHGADHGQVGAILGQQVDAVEHDQGAAGKDQQGDRQDFQEVGRFLRHDFPQTRLTTCR